MAFAGFQQARRYEAVAADRRYFTWYALDSLAALRAPEYLACLQTPTPRTQAAMPFFSGMIRSEFIVSAAAGQGIGGYVVCVRSDHEQVSPHEAVRWRRQPGVTDVQTWLSPPGEAPAPSSESRFRGAPDATAASALVIACLRERDASRIATAVAADVVADGSHVGTYRLLCCTDAS